jgi:hypothetical protein
MHEDPKPKATPIPPGPPTPPKTNFQSSDDPDEGPENQVSFRELIEATEELSKMQRKATTLHQR